jgi:hypothetical protein
MSGQVEHVQNVWRNRSASARRPLTPEVRKRNTGQELGDAIIDVLKEDAPLLAAAMKTGKVFRGDDGDLDVFEKVRTKTTPKLEYAPTALAR